MAEPIDEKPLEAVQETLQEAAKEETAAPRVRRYRTALFQLGLLGALVLFTFLMFLVKATPSFPIDVQITKAIQSIDSPIFAAFMTLISVPGFSPNSMITTVLITIVLYLYGLQWESVTALVASVSSGLANQLIKNFIQRPRPSVDLVNVFAVLDSYSFPSGHVMFYTVLFGYVWYLVYTLLKPSVLRSSLLGLFGSLILLVGASRIYLGQHWASDVLGAYLLGSVMLVAIVLFHQWGKTRFFVRQPVAPPVTTKD